MTSTLGDLARLVGGTLCSLSASEDAAIRIHGANPLADAVAGQITLVDSLRSMDRLASTQAAAAIVPLHATATSIPVIAVDDPHTAFEQVVRFFRPTRPIPRTGIHPTASISPTAQLAAGVSVGPGATIGERTSIGPGTTIHAGAHIAADCLLGRNVTIYPAAVLYDGTRIGDRVIIHSCAVIGAHGFGYRQKDGRHVPCAQLGYVMVGNDVEIGANTTIDRGTYGATVVGDGTKIDNLVQIGHNCHIGRHNIICSQVGIAGSTTTGDYVIMAGQVGVRDHVTIGKGAILSAMAGIVNDVPEGAVMMGIPATPEREQKIKQAALAKLAEMRKEFKKLQSTVAQLVRDTAQIRENEVQNGRMFDVCTVPDTKVL
ncbi:MAG: UDP-3-O-(3-hydroxymyristoyl)glucosamine N-acyltransferase [Pirellulales bacterium]|nr:UDP-3-O-(3-hydroxymyristoyl)glucosamine N-acyltransferase [Pirellulales bacterium]